MKWDNFYDASKLGVTKKYLTVTNAQGNLVQGTYSIFYNCNWADRNGNDIPSSRTGWQKLHTFTVVVGCSNELGASLNLVDKTTSDATLARLFLMSSPNFLSASCDALDVTKEDAFRKFDIDPLDGKLSAAELTEAFLKHDTDTTFVERLQKSGYFAKTGGILLSDVMNSKARPMHCKIVDETSDVFLTSSTYPTLETNKEECTSQMEKVDLVWDYKKKRTLFALLHRRNIRECCNVVPVKTMT